MTSFAAYANRLVEKNPCTNVYGLARTSVALGTLATLIANDTHSLFPNFIGSHDTPSHVGLRKYSFFCLLDFQYLDFLRLAAILILLVVASGWRPRFTGVLHWWVTFSFFISVPVIDGGDQLAGIISLLLVPVTLIDSRNWHWDRPHVQSRRNLNKVLLLFAHSCIVVISIQMAVVYFHAGTAKLNVEEWVNGTAVYYWFTHPVFGMPAYLRPLLMPVLNAPLTVVLLTWGSIIFEIVLFGAIFMRRERRKNLLPYALAFHFTILLVHGLFSFFFAIAGGLIMYLRPTSQPFAFPAFVKRRKPEAVTYSAVQELTPLS